MSVLPVPSEVVRFRVPADPQYVGALRQKFLGAISNGNLAEADLRGWGLAFNEAVFNAIHHGCGGVARAEIAVEWGLEEDLVRLAVEDPGPGPPDAVLMHPELPADPLAESGRGIFLLHEFADRIRGFRSHKGFRLEISKGHPGLGRLQGIAPEMESALEELTTCYESLSIFYRLAQNLHDSAALGNFIGRALDDFLRLHPSHRVFLLGAGTMPQPVRDALGQSPWFLHADDADGAMLKLLDISTESLWNAPEELIALGIDPRALRNAPAGCILPVRNAGVSFGSLIALRKAEHQGLTSGSLGILRTLADLFGIACANTHLGALRDHSRKKLAELEIAVEIQKSLLPILPPPVSPHWNVHIEQQSSLQVAGDYAMAATDSAGNLVVVIIDVMGKGVSAALLASIFRSAFDLSLPAATSADLLARINRHLCSQLGDLTMFITCATARFDLMSRTLDHASAGHCRTLHYNAEGIRGFLEPSGPPLGIVPDATYTSEMVHTRGGERFVFLTDGCYEWDREAGADAGWQHFLDLADSLRTAPPTVLWTELQTRIRESGHTVLEDDCTLLTLDIPQ